MKTVSIIIPVFNGSRTLQRCLKSVLSQTYPHIEIIVVDDGSTDKSRNLAERLLRKADKKDIITSSKNKGIESARKTGIANAHGDYIAFLDQDDFLEDTAIERMVEAMREYDADLIQCMSNSFLTLFRHIEIPLSLPTRKRNGKTSILDRKEIAKASLSFYGCGNFSVAVWGKLYKREHLEGLKNGDLLYGDDLYLNMQVFPKLNRICVLPDILHHYGRQGTSSHYMPLWMEESKQLFRLKMAAIEGEYANTARIYTAIELRNCLRAHIESMILYKVDTEDGIKQWIAQELQDNTYDVFNLLKQQGQYCQSPVSLAIVNKDIDNIYNLCRESVYQWNWTKILRRILTRL